MGSSAALDIPHVLSRCHESVCACLFSHATANSRGYSCLFSTERSLSAHLGSLFAHATANSRRYSCLFSAERPPSAHSAFFPHRMVLVHLHLSLLCFPPSIITPPCRGCPLPSTQTAITNHTHFKIFCIPRILSIPRILNIPRISSRCLVSRCKSRWLCLFSHATTASWQKLQPFARYGHHRLLPYPCYFHNYHVIPLF